MNNAINQIGLNDYRGKAVAIAVEKKITKLQWQWQPPQLISFITFVSNFKNFGLKKRAQTWSKNLRRSSSNGPTRNTIYTIDAVFAHMQKPHKYIKMREPAVCDVKRANQSQTKWKRERDMQKN